MTPEERAACDHEEVITICIYCGASLDVSKEHEEYVKALKMARVIYVKARQARQIVEAIAIERDMLRKVLGEAYSALKSLDLAEDALGMGQSGPDSWPLRDELYHNIEAALKLDEEEDGQEESD